MLLSQIEQSAVAHLYNVYLFRNECKFLFFKFWKMVDKQCDGLCTKYRLKMGDECEKMGIQKYVVAVM